MIRAVIKLLDNLHYIDVVDLFIIRDGIIWYSLWWIINYIIEANHVQ